MFVVVCFIGVVVSYLSDSLLATGVCSMLLAATVMLELNASEKASSKKARR